MPADSPQRYYCASSRQERAQPAGSALQNYQIPHSSKPRGIGKNRGLRRGIRTPRGLPHHGRRQIENELTRGGRHGHRGRRRDFRHRRRRRGLDDGVGVVADIAAGELEDRTLVLDDVQLALFVAKYNYGAAGESTATLKKKHVPLRKQDRQVEWVSRRLRPRSKHFEGTDRSLPTKRSTPYACSLLLPASTSPFRHPAKRYRNNLGTDISLTLLASANAHGRTKSSPLTTP